MCACAETFSRENDAKYGIEAMALYIVSIRLLRKALKATQAVATATIADAAMIVGIQKKVDDMTRRLQGLRTKLSPADIAAANERALQYEKNLMSVVAPTPTPLPNEIPPMPMYPALDCMQCACCRVDHQH